MQQCTVSVEDSFYEQLQQQADERGVSLSRVMRELMELGWQVKQASSDSGTSSEATYWEHVLNWQLETRLLARYILGYMTSHDEAARLVKQLKAKSDDHVKGLMGYDVNTEYHTS